jgi:hypothetical protein
MNIGLGGGELQPLRSSSSLNHKTRQPQDKTLHRETRQDRYKTLNTTIHHNTKDKRQDKTNLGSRVTTNKITATKIPETDAFHMVQFSWYNSEPQGYEKTVKTERRILCVARLGGGAECV